MLLGTSRTVLPTVSQAKVRKKVGKPATEMSSQITLLCFCKYVITAMFLQFSYVEVRGTILDV